ncbi:hypothetical protein SUGI_0208780 [Cryptomeria japonica]|nr:hypothetical protein SUGI_0208780 [Cryptomeria japonica]
MADFVIFFGVSDLCRISNSIALFMSELSSPKQGRFFVPALPLKVTKAKLFAEAMFIESKIRGRLYNGRDWGASNLQRIKV